MCTCAAAPRDAIAHDEVHAIYFIEGALHATVKMMVEDEPSRRTAETQFTEPLAPGGPSIPEQAVAQEYGQSLALFRAAIALSFVSQFFTYEFASYGGTLTHETNTDYYTGLSTWSTGGGNGWDVHSLLSIAPLALLIWIYFTRARNRHFWSTRGHWLAAALLLVCALGDPHARGTQLGLIAFATAVWGAFRRRGELIRGN